MAQGASSKVAAARRGEGGFTLVEVMIVVAIIALIASFAIPGLEDARRLANEAGAVSASRALYDAQINYQRKHGTPALPYALSLEELRNRNLLPAPIGTTPSGPATIRGYRVFTTYVVSDEPTLVICAFPESFGKTGNLSFLIRDDGVIYRRAAPGPFFDPSLGQPLQ